MEENTLAFTNLEQAIDAFIADFVNTYKLLLIRDDKKASGNLIKSIHPLTIVFSSNKMVGSISLASYWKYVEYGRKAGGKFPPFDKILKWIQIKPVLPRPINGIKPTQKQLAFLISRKIARDGIKAGKQYDEALNIVWQRQKENISNAISMDLDTAIDLIRL